MNRYHNPDHSQRPLEIELIRSMAHGPLSAKQTILDKPYWAAPSKYRKPRNTAALAGLYFKVDRRQSPFVFVTVDRLLKNWYVQTTLSGKGKK